MSQFKPDTLAIHGGHGGEEKERVKNSVTFPIFQTSTFEYPADSDYDEILYTRLNNNPNQVLLGQRLAQLEAGEAALVTSSGMAAICSAFYSLFKPGDHVLVQNGVYGGTHAFITERFKTMGLEYDFIDAYDPKSWQTFLKPTTRAIYVEAISNPLILVCDLKAASDFAKQNKLIAMIDNTFASPINFSPLKHGFDLSFHSATKYLNGHSDVIAGAVIGSNELIASCRKYLNLAGGPLDPHACFLLERGIKTLGVRVRQQNSSALAVARFLNIHSQVSQVNYPGLESHPHFARAKSMFTGMGGMLSFDLKDGLEATQKLVKNLKLIIHAPSLGGVESLITRPVASTHAKLTEVERKKISLSPSLLRLSVGLEDTSDLIDDLAQSLKMI